MKFTFKPAGLKTKLEEELWSAGVTFPLPTFDPIKSKIHVFHEAKLPFTYDVTIDSIARLEAQSLKLYMMMYDIFGSNLNRVIYQRKEFISLIYLLNTQTYTGVYNSQAYLYKHNGATLAVDGHAIINRAFEYRPK